jgi:predicted ATPase/class 3 adenylate cyclase
LAHELPISKTFPTGTVTFLFTDIQGSTPLWEQEPEQMVRALQIHNDALRGTIQAHGGIVFKTVGDAFQAAFPTALEGLRAAIAGQRALQTASWNELGELKVRMGLHTGEAQLDPGGDEYAVSHTKNRIGRIHSVAHGGQILLSQETRDLVQRNLPEGVTLKDLGEHRLKGMQWLEHLFQACAPGLQEDFPALAATITHPNNLPLELTSFIGRQNEVSQVKDLLHAHRLVTLTGSGGVGKTRLSIQVAEDLLDTFPDGVWYIELAPVSDPEMVPQTVAAALGLHEDPNRSILEVLGSYLERRQLLLVLDNCEHLLTACARLADNLLRRSPALKLCASSREALGIAGEIAFHVPSLATPDPDQLPDLELFTTYEAVRLFAERARAAVPSFQVEARNMPAIAQICRRLDGIPLALELAAPRLKMLTTAQLASRLDNAFRLLTGGSRTALPRQQTLQATIDWSYQLLNPQERLLLQRLAVFAGGFSLEGVEQVCAGEDLDDWEIFDRLASLVDKSIVIAERGPNKEVRYHLLETVRQYARQRLFESGVSQAVHDRHLQYYLQLAETIEPQLKTSLALERLAVLSQEAANFRAALSWALESEETANIAAGLRLAAALLNFWHTQNFHTEGYGWLRKGLDRLPEAVDTLPIRARACFSIGHLILPLFRGREAQKWMEASLRIYQRLEDPKGIVTAQSMLGEILAWNGDYERSIALGEASVAECRGLDDPWSLAWVLCRLGTSLFLQYRDRGEHLQLRDSIAEQERILEESLSIFEQVGDQLQIGDHCILLGWMALSRGDLTQASMYFDRALVTAQAMKSSWTEANALHGLGTVAYGQGEYRQMKTLASQGLAIRREMGLIEADPGRFYNLGVAELHLGETHEAVQHFRECLKISTDHIVSMIGIARAMLQSNRPRVAARLLGAAKRFMTDLWIWQKEYEDAWKELQQQIDLEALAQAFEEGQELTLEEAVALALEVSSDA